MQNLSTMTALPQTDLQRMLPCNAGHDAFPFDRSTCKAAILQRFTTPYVYAPAYPEDAPPVHILPLFSCPEIAENERLQDKVVHLATEFLDMLLFRDALIQEKQATLGQEEAAVVSDSSHPSTFFDHENLMNCPIFRTTRHMTSWVIFAAKTLSPVGPFKTDIATFHRACVTERPEHVETDMAFPRAPLLQIVVSSVLKVREDLTSRQRGYGDIPNIKTEGEAHDVLSKMIFRPHTGALTAERYTKARKLAQGIIECGAIPVK